MLGSGAPNDKSISISSVELRGLACAGICSKKMLFFRLTSPIAFRIPLIHASRSCFVRAKNTNGWEAVVIQNSTASFQRSSITLKYRLEQNNSSLPECPRSSLCGLSVQQKFSASISEILLSCILACSHQTGTTLCF